MTTDAPTIPRLRLALTVPRPRVAAEWFSTCDRGGWPAAPVGDGRPVMLIPGFLAGDASLTRMALWLRSGGFELALSGIARNTGCMESTVESLEGRLERAVERIGQPAVLIGQSRGGTIARALTALRPDLVHTLVTLGSPLLDQLDVTLRVWPSIGLVGLLGSLGVPGMFSFSCLSGDCCARTRAAVNAPFPEGVRFLSLYSRSDEVVRWRTCLDPAAEQHEVTTSHIGMAMARSVWITLTAELDARRSRRPDG
jgi:triacylglycerol lipase